MTTKCSYCNGVLTSDGEEHDILDCGKVLRDRVADLNAALSWAMEWVSPPSRSEYATQESYREHMKEWEAAYVEASHGRNPHVQKDNETEQYHANDILGLG